MNLAMSTPSGQQNGTSASQPTQTEPACLPWYARLPALLLLLIAVWAIWIFWWCVGPSLAPGDDPAARGAFGDMFGTLNALFSGLAFAAFTFTILFQGVTLRLQREDLRSMEDTQNASSMALRKQAEATEFALRIQAMDAVITALATQLKQPGKTGGESDLLRQELDQAICDLRNLIASKGHDAFKDFPAMYGVTELKDQDVLDLIQEHVPYIPLEDIQAQLENIRSNLIRSGINTRQRLQRLLQQTESRHVVERLYVEELLRNPDTPLDPLATVVWPSFLFIQGKSENELREVLRTSPEYRLKHRPVGPFRHYGQEHIVSLPFVVHIAPGTITESPNWREARVEYAKARESTSADKVTLWRFNYDTDPTRWERVDDGT